jgi:hypothetical protein
VEVNCLVEDASNATAERIAKEAHSQLSRLSPAQAGALAVAAGGGRGGGASWIARAPISIKLRLFCLPYAGGVSENVFGRWAFWSIIQNATQIRCHLRKSILIWTV